MKVYYLIVVLVINLSCIFDLSQTSNQPNVVNSHKNRSYYEIKKLLHGNGLTLNCGTQLKSLAGRVVGGREAEDGEFPWQVSLQLKHRFFGYRHFCGGTIIGNRWIVTAAHCANHIDNNNTIAVLGAIDLTPFQYHVKAAINSTFVHPNYNQNTIENDIALLKTSEKIDLTGQNYPISSACLPESLDQQPSGNAIVTGFGKTSESGGSSSTLLRAAEIPVMSLEACKEYYGNRVYPKMLCAGYKEGKHDSCQGDSGGPLVQIVDNHGVLVGVVSWGIGCARPAKPGVYTKVSSYIDWIYETIEANQ
ncbi:trypsin-like [Tetranychus urticae]|uniref:Peptidase S1 domain-containing protein n=1 Tax=Tetranychus urticae TaxID=32264 RepID=T1K4V3_TETUR|nr:trypsin-like [Tetranychus urticae]